MKKSSQKYAVSHIIDKKVKKTKKGPYIYYKIAWKDYPLEQATWEPQRNLTGKLFKKEIESFEQKLKHKDHRSTKDQSKKTIKENKKKQKGLNNGKNDGYSEDSSFQMQPKAKYFEIKTKRYFSKNNKFKKPDHQQSESSKNKPSIKQQHFTKQSRKMTRSQIRYCESSEESQEQGQKLSQKQKKSTDKKAGKNLNNQQQQQCHNSNINSQDDQNLIIESFDKAEKEERVAKLKILLKQKSIPKKKQNTVLGSNEEQIEKQQNTQKQGKLLDQPQQKSNVIIIKEEEQSVSVHNTHKPLTHKEQHPIVTEENQKELLRSYESSKEPAPTGLGIVQSKPQVSEKKDSIKFEIKGMINCKGQYYYLVEHGAQSKLLSREEVLKSHWYELVCFYERRINIQPAEVNFVQL